MVIADSLRQEHEPSMVYSICKLIANNDYSLSQLNEIMNDKDSDQKVFSKNLKFCEDCGFISIKSQVCECLISYEYLTTYESFINYISLNVFDTENNFTKLTRWFLSQDISVSQIAAEQLASKCHDAVTVDQNFIRGWHWWMIAFGLATVSSHIKSGGRYALFDCSEALRRFVIDNCQENEIIKVRTFLTNLVNKKKEFKTVVDLKSNANTICDSVSMSLRILHNLNIIELLYTPDSSDIWHLTESYSHKVKKDITEIRIIRR